MKKTGPPQKLGAYMLSVKNSNGLTRDDLERLVVLLGLSPDPGSAAALDLESLVGKLANHYDCDIDTCMANFRDTSEMYNWLLDDPWAEA